MAIRTVKDLQPNKENPRSISPQRLASLKNSLGRFGDLSGVVVNVYGGKNILISGHQRTKTLDKNSKIEKKPHKDEHGTVALGHIVTSNGIKIPYREVNWSNKESELAALIGANAHGGQFDQAKLGALVQKLEKNKFEIELTGLDSVEARRSIMEFKKNSEGRKSEAVTEAAGKAFKEYTVNDISGKDVSCPHCGKHFLYSDKGVETSSKNNKKVVKKQKSDKEFLKNIKETNKVNEILRKVETTKVKPKFKIAR